MMTQIQKKRGPKMRKNNSMTPEKEKTGPSRKTRHHHRRSDSKHRHHHPDS